MDSCHIFSFLFGTKKATTELSKRFSSELNSRQQERSGTKSTASSSSEDPSAISGLPKSCPSTGQPPLSPFKQLQMKLVGLAPNYYISKNKSNFNIQEPKKQTQPNNNGGKDNQDQETCDSNCKIYRATLIHSIDDEDDHEGKNDCVDDENNNILVTVDADGKLISSTFTRASPPIVGYRTKIFENPTSIMDENNNLISQSDESSKSTKSSNFVRTASDNDAFSNNQEAEPEANRANFKRVVMYGSYDDDHNDLTEQKKIVSSAEVFKIVSESGQSRAKLRKISSVSMDGSSKEHDEADVTISSEDVNDELEVAQVRCNRKFCVERTGENHNSCSEASPKKDVKSIHVRSLVQSFESNSKADSESKELVKKDQSATKANTQPISKIKPITFVKPLPPKTPPKTSKAKFLTLQLSMNKPFKIQQLFQEEKFLVKFFDKLQPLDRCVAAQVCRLWRNILYANQDYWKDLINVIDCTQLRREHLVECIINALQSAKLKQSVTSKGGDSRASNIFNQHNQAIEQVQEWSPGSCHDALYFDFDQDDVWRVQELCNKFTYQRATHSSSKNHIQTENSNNVEQQQQANCITSKSSSIPSQISSTLSSISISSLLSPLSESSRIDSIKEKLYTSLDNRGFDAICLFGATDDDIEDLILKLPTNTHKKILIGKLNNCSITDRGLELFSKKFSLIEELELTGCNELTNSMELIFFKKLKKLTITDCINIADGFAQKLIQIVEQLDELTIQAYHLTDAFLEYLSFNSDTSLLLRLELPNCKELTNQSLIVIAKQYQQLEALSLSGSTKISDEGIEILSERMRNIKHLDLSWCTRITDASLECIACDLGDTVTELILDRNIHITDVGISYLTTMNKLTLLHLRWCPRVTDTGLESIISGIRSLKYLSIAGLHQITARSLLCLIESNLEEIELTNCPAVNSDLILYLKTKLPRCNIIF